MDTARIRRTEPLRTEVLHVRSGQRFITDAPVDNQGKGEAISPTDLLAASLGACIITTMDIRARERGLDLGEVTALIVKHMASDPRRVIKVEVRLEMDGDRLGDADRMLMERTARTCPVALSLHPDIEQDVIISYR